ncbi:MAG: hypothetical protein IKI26_10525 [Prevotella sp.]|nr:hypothetical protein [Prevotella sp.]
MLVANPIYDIVFKYLMEDERIARTILSALLKKEVVAVEMRPHEYANISRDTLSVFRIDFGATVKEEDGTLHLVLIELQKTWVETEALRFRQYLGVQYSSPKNIDPKRKDGAALPMVAVYILGHKVGDIEEPVLYVNHKAYDYDDKIVTKGLPNPFVDSLTHNSIIVQIPRLRGKVNNRLDKVLSIFDQSRVTSETQQMLSIDESAYSNDDDMMHIVHRLVAAAANTEMRFGMNVEDEYYSVIEKRDTDIMLKNKIIAKNNAIIKEQENQLKERDTQLKEQENQLKERDTQLKEQENQLKERDTQLKERDTQLKEQENQLKERDTQLQTSIKMLLRAGLSPETIANQLGVNLQMVKDFLSSDGD